MYKIIIFMCYSYNGAITKKKTKRVSKEKGGELGSTDQAESGERERVAGPKMAHSNGRVFKHWIDFFIENTLHAQIIPRKIKKVDEHTKYLIKFYLEYFHVENFS